MKHLSKADVEEAICFILDECIRFAKMPICELKRRDTRDYFCYLPHPNGRDRMLCGHLAEAKLWEIAEEGLRLNNLAGRVSAKTLRGILGSELVKRFVIEKRAIDARQIDRLMSWLGRAAVRKCSSRTHFIPCHLMYVDEPEELSVGPVTLRSRKSFRSQILPLVRGYDPGGDSKWTRKLLSGALHYYRGFKWFVEVAVPLADSELSEKIAWEAATAALNCLHLCFGAEATDKMVLGGPRLERDNRAHLQIDSDGKLRTKLRVGGLGQVGFASGWSTEWVGSEAELFIKLSGVALEIVVDPDLQRPVSRRVLDAIYWFGEGVRETGDAAKVVKYVTALERMLMTNEGDDIAKLVSERCAAFCLTSDEPITLEQWRAEALGLYELRSRLVHGDMSPLSKEVRSGARLGAKIARLVILAALRHLGEEGLHAERVSTSRLARWFDAIVSASEQFARERQVMNERVK